MLHALAKNWWILLVRGVLAIAFGIVTFAWPGLTLLTLAWVFAFYAVSGGLLAIGAAATGRGDLGFPWWSLLVEGILGVVVGIMAFAWPGIYLLVLLYLIAAWAIVTGIFQVVAAIRLRKEIEGELFLALGGVLTVILGVLLAANPGAGLLFIAYMVGGYAVAFGILMILLSLKLRKVSRHTPIPAA